ncbi:MAG: hypothetical protein HFJ75_07660 [Eggerthellaceae bacterium]|nr:hypothetical protein [Eggerthellaceae bacterium]
MRYRKKPVEVEAWLIGSEEKMPGWLLDAMSSRIAMERVDGSGWLIKTLEGDHFGNVGDYIIRGVKGELYPCKPDIFEETYLPVDDSLGEEGGATSVELLPCPFCGGEAVPPNDRDHHVSCSKCYARGSNWAEYDSAVAAWNARAERTCEWREDVDGGLYCYDTECGREYRWSALPLLNYCPGCGAKVVR